MKLPNRSRVSRSRVAQAVSIPAPVGGLNSKDSIANMPPTDAFIMDNWFPTASNVVLRNGMSAYKTGFAAAINTLATYNGLTTTKMFAAAGTAIYDATVQGAVGAAVVTGLTSDKFQYVNMGTVGGRFLCMFNGADNGQYYDGAAWINVSIGAGATQIANVDPKNIINVNIFKNRMFLVEKNTANVWYLPLNAIYGAASKLDFSSLLNFGGNILAMTTWTVDNTAGMQEYAVFISSIGEVLVYSGSDPAVAANWTLSNRFNIGRPAGYRCYERVGSDVVIMGADGLFPLSKALVTDRAQTQYAVTDKIVTSISNDFQVYGNNFGWQVLLYPIGSKLIINVPNGIGSYQYVMNTITGAWCRFTGWTASCFARMNDDLFFGGTTAVYQCDDGVSDNGAQINGDCQQAFQYFGSSNQKKFTMARPILQTNGTILVGFNLNLDFDLTKPTNVVSVTTAGATYWGSPWGSPWSAQLSLSKNWQSVGGFGFSAAPRLLANSANVTISWQSTDIVFENGGTL